MTVAAGEIFDVAVDLRPRSATSGHFVVHRLSSDAPAALYVPPGFEARVHPSQCLILTPLTRDGEPV